MEIFIHRILSSAAMDNKSSCGLYILDGHMKSFTFFRNYPTFDFDGPNQSKAFSSCGNTFLAIILANLKCDFKFAKINDPVKEKLMGYDYKVSFLVQFNLQGRL
jgi:hypothetical protein